MPLDPSIPLQVQNPKFESPMNQLAMMESAAKLGEYRNMAEEKNALRTRMSQGEFDINNPAHQRELYAIAPTTAPKIIGEMAVTSKNLAQGAESKFKTESAKIDRAISDIANHDTPQSALSSIQDSVTKGILPPEKGQMLIDQLKSMPFEKFQMTQIKNLVSAKDRYMHETVGAGTQATLNQAAQFHKESDTVGTLTPESITNAAARYNIDGTLPPLGMGAKGATMRSQILNEAAVQAKNSGVSPEDQRIAQIGNAANKSSLTQLSKSEAMVGAFEKNFNRNADLALKQSTVVDSTGVPIVNSWINAGKRSVTGDPKLSAYDAAIKATVNEYAKIISGSMGNTATALGEIKKVNDLLAAAQTPEQVAAVIGMMKQETQNRMTGFKEQKAELTSGMKGKKNNANPSSPSVAPPSGFTID